MFVLGQVVDFCEIPQPSYRFQHLAMEILELELGNDLS